MQYENTLDRSMFAFDADLTRNPKLADTLFLMTVGVLLAWSLVSSIISNTALTQDHVGLLMRMVLAMAVLRLIFHNRFTLYVTFSIIAVASAMFVWDIYFAEEMSDATAVTVEFISGVVNFAAGIVPHTMAYEQAVVWALIFGIALFVLMFSYLWFNFIVLLGVSVFTIGISLNYGFFTYAPSFYAFVLCTLANLIKYLHTRRSWKLLQILAARREISGSGVRDAASPPSGKRVEKMSQNSYFALYALPMIIVCILAALVIPKPAEGFAQNITATLVTTPIDRATTFIHATFRPKHFSLSQTGFGTGASRLGGNVVLNDDVIMRVRADGPLYLTGNILDTYTGYAWINSLGDDTYAVGDGMNLELIERASSLIKWLMLYSDMSFIQVSEHLRHITRYFGHGHSSNLLLQHYLLSLIDVGNALDVDLGIFSAYEVEVNVGDFRTFSAFYSGLLSEMEGVNTQIEFLKDQNGTIITDILLPRNATYRFVHHELEAMFDTSDLAAVSYRGILHDTLFQLENRPAESADLSLIRVRNRDFEPLYADLLRNYLIPRADWIYDVYTTLPEDFPERVRQLAQNVTAYAQNDYERARLIESYLLRFGYTLTPGNTPLDRDFVDYFLFDLQMGYCTYFASAFVTMARSVGLPARYVEGFNVTGFPDEFGYIDVTNEQGHAWGEVYFEGFGWKRFEPTPGGGGIPASDLWDGYGMGFYWEDYTWWDDMLGWGWEPGEYGAEFGETTVTIGGAAAQGAAAAAIFGRFAHAALIVAAVIISVALARAVWVFRRIKLAGSADNNDAVVDGFYAILKYLKFFKIEINDSETAIQFAGKIDSRVDFAHDQLHMNDVARIFSKARYSGHSITAQERETVERALRNLDTKMLSFTGKARYMYYKYILAVV
ncbi:MAG: transglutaminase domain-containing protein [Defluviitaleaceae bacterium]|nr:transglutaminase domain-containing protein [Defluviitaleaceae bacterium]